MKWAIAAPFLVFILVLFFSPEVAFAACAEMRSGFENLIAAIVLFFAIIFLCAAFFSRRKVKKLQRKGTSKPKSRYSFYLILSAMFFSLHFVAGAARDFKFNGMYYKPVPCCSEYTLTARKGMTDNCACKVCRVPEPPPH